MEPVTVSSAAAMAAPPALRGLDGRRVVLASASPRRRDILRLAGLRFETSPSLFREALDKAAFPDARSYAVRTARHKALEVARREEQRQRAPDLVIAADTVVAVDGLILEKPLDEEDACRMLTRLSGREHGVVTGVCLLRCWTEGHRLRARRAEFCEETRVRFQALTPGLVRDYVASGESLDKAGGYGLQDAGAAALVECVRGDVLNAVGFPLRRFCAEVGALFPPPAAQAPDAPPRGGDTEAAGRGGRR